MRSVAAVVALAACLHAGCWVFLQSRGAAPDIPKNLSSVSYAPFEGKRLADDVAPAATEAQIRADLTAIAPHTDAIRTYSSTGGLEFLPPIAAELGLRVTLGIKIGPDDKRNEVEIASAIELVRHNSNINQIIVGNETILELGTSRSGSRPHHQVRPTGQAPDQPTGQHWRNLGHMARPSRPRQQGRFHRCPHPPLLGPRHLSGRRRSCAQGLL